MFQFSTLSISLISLVGTSKVFSQNFSFSSAIDYLSASISVWLPLVLFTFGFFYYFFSSKFNWLVMLSRKIGGTNQHQEVLVYLTRIIGFSTLGLIPFGIVKIFFPHDFSETGSNVPVSPNLLWWIIVPSLFFLVGILLRPKKNIDINFYPQVRQSTWGVMRVFMNSVSWMLYLLGYEFMFRGLLFFPIAAEMGVVPAIAINCALYVMAHLHKGTGEAFGAFFLGIVLCIIAVATQSWIIPWFLHCILALGNDYTAVKAHPKMKFKSSFAGSL